MKNEGKGIVWKYVIVIAATLCLITGLIAVPVLSVRGGTAEKEEGGTEPDEFGGDFGEVAIVMLGAESGDQDAVYDGGPKDLVKEVTVDGVRLENRPGDIRRAEYSTDNRTWEEAIPQGTEAGEYPSIYIRIIEKGQTETGTGQKDSGEGDIVRYTSRSQTAVIRKAPQTIVFENEAYQTNDSMASVTKMELDQGKVFDFTAVDGKRKEKNEKITYSLDVKEPGIASIDSKTGELTVRDAGEVVVTAFLSGDRNHEEGMAVHTLRIMARPSKEGELVRFDAARVTYVAGSGRGIVANPARAACKRDDGRVTYRIAHPVDIGLEIVEEGEGAGTVSVADYSKLLSAVEAAGGTLKVEVRAEKEAGGRVPWGNLYGADAASCLLAIICHTPPADAYRICGPKGETLAGENGSNGWYRTAVSIVPKEGYEIIRADALGRNPDFGREAVFGNSSGDQGQGKEWAIYLREISSGEITRRIIAASGVNMDSEKPYHLSIEFPQALTGPEAKGAGQRRAGIQGIRYYGGQITVTLAAYDRMSGVDSFQWEYVGADGSGIIPGYAKGEVEAAADPQVPCRYTAAVTLPEEEAGQLKGYLRITARDKAGVSSDSLMDSTLFVVDTVAPALQVTYGPAGPGGSCQSTGDGKHYFSGGVEFVFEITEGNFFGEDVMLYVSRDGNTPVRRQDLLWEDADTPDGHRAAVLLSEDGSYRITIRYRDRSQNEMASYTSDVVVVDSRAPEMTAEYTKADKVSGQKAYYSKAITAAFTIRETNFFPEDVVVTLRKDGAPAVRIRPSWRNSYGDVHVGTYTIQAPANHGADGDYILEAAYRDKSGNLMKPYRSGILVVDTIPPAIKVEYEDNSPVNVQTDREGNMRSYFGKTQQATITVTEHNFNEEEVEDTIIAKDVAGNVLEDETLYQSSPWVSRGDIHVRTITYPGDANYTFDISCRDLAGLEAAGYETDYFTVDTTRPSDLQISYSTSVLDTILSNISFGFYQARVRVTLTATDEISGIHSFLYSYKDVSEDSGADIRGKEVSIDADGITCSEGGAKGTVSFEVPGEVQRAGEQFNGTVSFTAADRAGNEGDYLRDTKRIVVDTIPPAGEVAYNAPVQEEGQVAYYDGHITGTVTVREANFYPEDVTVHVKRDGEAYPVDTVWDAVGKEIHKGTFILSGDGSYSVGIICRDKSGNRMQDYASGQMVIDTQIPEATITVNGERADGRAFREEVVPAVRFGDQNLEDFAVTLTRTSYAARQEDVSKRFIGDRITADGSYGGGSFDTFSRAPENDGIYTMTVSLRDKAGHTRREQAVFTVNRFGSVYEYSDYLTRLIQNGGAYIQAVEEDFVIREYNADRLLGQSLNIEISRDGKPVENVIYEASAALDHGPAADGKGWFQYVYTIDKDNFTRDGVYKIAVSSRDAAGNSPENTGYDDKGILFRVDSTAPEIISISGLEDSVVDAAEQEVRYTAYDTIGLASISIYVGGGERETITNFSEDANYYSGSFVLEERPGPQAVRLVVEDLAGNITDTDAEGFTSSYDFHNLVTVSTNVLVRWAADRSIVRGALIGGVGLAVAGAGILWRKRRRDT